MAVLCKQVWGVPYYTVFAAAVQYEYSSSLQRPVGEDASETLQH